LVMLLQWISSFLLKVQSSWCGLEEFGKLENVI
jgi:hypothetical protein